MRKLFSVEILIVLVRITRVEFRITGIFALQGRLLLVSFSCGSQDIVFDDSRPWPMLEDRFRLIRYIGAVPVAS
jgi:hypothetical protein